MAIDPVNLGAALTGAGGDNLREAFEKVNDNFANLAWDDVGSKPTEFPPEAHTHGISDITDLAAYTGLDVRYYTESEVDALLSGLASALGDLTDVTITTPAVDEVLTYNGSAWVNAPVSGGGDFLPLAGGTVTGAVDLQGQVRTTPGSNLGTSGTLTLDLSGASLRSTGALTGNITFATSNRAAGRSVTVRVVNGATLRTLTFPGDWVFVGAKPADIAADAVGILTITAFGTADSDVVAAWAVSE